MLLGTQTEMDKSMNEKKIFHQAVGFIFNLRLLSASIYIITWIARYQQYERNIFPFFVFYSSLKCALIQTDFFFMQVNLLHDTTSHISFQRCQHFKCTSYIRPTTM